MIEVSDTGCGIDEKDLPHIFERFYQIKDDNAPAGSGIGLHLVKEYARLHNGDITVSSQINIGSTFTVYIPVDLPKSNDKNHQEAGVWTRKGRWYMMRGAETEPLQALSGKTDQSEYAALWSAFFHQIGIKERENPACQRTRLPLRYRKYMTEFQSGSNRSNLAKL